MSGHSKWSTIKRQKAANDKERGKSFSKLSRAITIAAKTGGGPSLDNNYKLRIAVDAAKAENMPRDTIDRAINKASGGDQLDEVTYEGFGPAGVNLMIQTATDNRNRTAQELKSILERSGGSMGQPGSVSFNFELKGLIVVAKQANGEEQILSLIDLGVEDVADEESTLEVYTKPQELFEIKNKIDTLGYKALSAELIQKPKILIELSEEKANKLLSTLEQLENNEDVQRVFDNAKLDV